MSISELREVLEYFDERLFEKYQRRNLTPLQFAKEKDGKLKDRLKSWNEKLSGAKEKGDAQKVKIYKDRIKQIKLLLNANKERIKIEKEREK